MSTENTNGQESAFPLQPTFNSEGQICNERFSYEGLTKREYFAAMFLPVAVKDIGDMTPDAIIKKYHLAANFNFFEWSAMLYSLRAIELADTLLEKLNQTP